MDERELVRRSRALPDRFADRLSEHVVSMLRVDSEGGEWAELVDNTVAALVQAGAAVTQAERDDLAVLVVELKLKTAEPVGKLTVQG